MHSFLKALSCLAILDDKKTTEDYFTLLDSFTLPFACAFHGEDLFIIYHGANIHTPGNW